MTAQSWPAPAKLNLFLHILGRRQDGYHRLQTLFQLLDYGDELEFIPSPGGVITLETDYGTDPVDDLIFRAARLLSETTDTCQGITIRVKKRIPMGGGLGGGSSDAATTLVALNALWETGLTIAELLQLGLTLGADVPVFIQGHSAWAEGIGEELEPLSLPEASYLVIHPGCHVDTARVFSHPDLTRNSAPITIRDFTASACRNDCEAVVFSEFPQVAEAASWLGQWTEAHLTGTGACIYGRFDSKALATDVLLELPEEWHGFVAGAVNESPLLQRLGQQTEV